MTFVASEILNELDATMDIDYSPAPMMNMVASHFQRADARMSVFCGVHGWIIIFELIGYTRPINKTVNEIYAYGDMPWRDEVYPGIQSQIFLEPYIIANSISDDEVPELAIQDRSHLVVYRDGILLDLHPTDEDYLDAGLNFEKTTTRSLTYTQCARFLCHYTNHQLFHSEGTLRAFIDLVANHKSVSHKMKLIIQTREWQHPNLCDEKPSDIPDFHVIARAIDNADGQEWTNHRSENSNTDWKHHLDH